MATGRRAGAIASIGLTGAPNAPTELDRLPVAEEDRPDSAPLTRTDGAEVGRSDGSPQQRSTAAPSRRSRVGTGTRRNGVPSRRRPADDGTSVKYTVLFTKADAFAADDLMTTLGRARGRKVEKSQVVRELLRMAGEDKGLRDRLLDRLGDD
jgi:hypothetical protein